MPPNEPRQRVARLSGQTADIAPPIPGCLFEENPAPLAGFSFFEGSSFALAWRRERRRLELW